MILFYKYIEDGTIKKNNSNMLNILDSEIIYLIYKNEYEYYDFNSSIKILNEGYNLFNNNKLEKEIINILINHKNILYFDEKI